MQKIEDKAFVLLLVAATLAFGWILAPFSGAILWGVVFAILFHPLHLRLRKAMAKRPNLAAALIVLLVIAIVILPLLLVSALLGQEASSVYGKVRSGQMDFSQYVQQIFDALPAWIKGALGHFGLNDLSAVKAKLSQNLAEGSKLIAAQSLRIGLSAFDFILGAGIMLYLLFFLMRDGENLLAQVKQAVPLHASQKTLLLNRIAQVMRATVEGGIAVALVQGVLGGLAFWVLGIPAPLLWGAVMALASLVPAIGAGLIWGPVALYLLATGAIWQGLLLIFWGVVVIGLADNLLRPFLVGKSTKLPDYVILISTLGGIDVLGINGLVVGPLVAAICLACWDIFRRPAPALKN